MRDRDIKMNHTTPPNRPRPPRERPQSQSEREQRGRLTRARRAREIRRARIELALIGLGIVAVIAVLTAVIVIAVRSNRSNREAGVNGAVLQLEQDSITAAQTAVDTQPQETGLLQHAQKTDSTRVLGSEIDSQNAILIDLASNEVLMTKDGDARIYPASMTKIMTLIVAYENMQSLEDTFEMTADIVDALYIANATVAGFVPGEKARIDDLMYGLILPSGGDCAVALAVYTAGSESAFAELMNKKAVEIGLTSTHFVNPSGLHDPEQYSTCHEIAMILEYALKDDFMRKVLSTYEYTTHSTSEHPEGISLRSTMLERMYGDEAPGMFMVGGKTGYTTEAKNCLASFAVRYDKASESEESVYEKAPEYIFVTAYGPDKWAPVFDAINAYALVLDENALETKQHSNQ